MQGRYKPRPVWPIDELLADAAQSIEAFIAERGRIGAPDYETHFDNARAEVRDLFERTDMLQTLADGKAFVDKPALISVGRNLVSPVLSEDDFNTLLRQSLAKRTRLTTDEGRAIGNLVAMMLDRKRFAWMFRPDLTPTRAELEAATLSTTGALAAQRTQTDRRNQSASRQQNATAAALTAAGYTYVNPPRERDAKGRMVSIITAIDQLKRGIFTRETIVDRDKCDVPVRLLDGRLLLIECKVSSSSLNSLKRLNDVIKKAFRWSVSFGRDTSLTAAVLSGVFKVDHLERAQAEISIFWEQDVSPLIEFVKSAQ